MSQAHGTLLVVDDNEMNRDMLSRRLSRQGYEVVTAESGREALALIAGRHFDLALLDVMMPEVSGLEVLAEVRQRHSLADLPVIMVTAKTHSEDIVEALKLGANDYVTKPIDFPVLLARVRTHLQLRHLSALKDEFMRIASHDIKNPLTEVMGIAGLVELVAKPDQPLPDQVFNLLGNLKRSAKKIQRIIEDFLDFQALEEGELRLTTGPIDLNALARDYIDGNLTYAEQKSLALVAELDPQACAVTGDADRIGQVIENFVNNAIKFSRAGATTTVRTRRVDGFVRFEVCDEGPGLKPEDFEKLFQKYARLSNAPTGGEKSSGLGLAIAKQLIEAQHGRIGAENNPGAGATFWFELPASG